MFIQYEENYPFAPGALLEVWSDERFLRYKYARLQQTPRFIQTRPGSDSACILSVYRTPLVPPGPLRSLVPLKLHARQLDVWTSHVAESIRGTWSIELAELPLRMSGSMSLRATESRGSIFAVNCQVVARGMGVAGALLAQLAAQNFRRTLWQVERITLEWLDIQASAMAPVPRAFESSPAAIVRGIR